jgi:hypothetical protein
MARDPASRPQTVQALRAELAAVDLDPDDATSMLSPDPTPTDGVAVTTGTRRAPTARPLPAAAADPAPGAAAGPKPAARPRRAAIVLPALALLAIGVIATVLTVGRGDANSDKSRRASGNSTPLHVTGATAFDPLGNGNEHNAEAHLAIDGDPATAWHTERYNAPRFGGGLKNGVGLIVRVDGEPTVHELQVTSPTSAWAAEVYVAATPATTLEQWGQPVATQQSIDGDATFDLSNATGGAVLLWITDTGTTEGNNQTEIAEVALS